MNFVLIRFSKTETINKLFFLKTMFFEIAKKIAIKPINFLAKVFIVN